MDSLQQTLYCRLLKLTSLRAGFQEEQITSLSLSILSRSRGLLATAEYQKVLIFKS